MTHILRFIKNLFLLNSCLETDKDRQAKDGYRLEFSNIGPERYVTYYEKGRKIEVLADFTLFNDVILHTHSLRKWSKPSGEELTPFDYEKVLNRVTRYLSCWGEVTLNETKLRDNEDLKRSLTEQGVEFVETDDDLILYSVDADVYREQIEKGKI
jgi:hypothetical protein